MTCVSGLLHRLGCGVHEPLVAAWSTAGRSSSTCSIRSTACPRPGLHDL